MKRSRKKLLARNDLKKRNTIINAYILLVIAAGRLFELNRRLMIQHLLIAQPVS